MACKCDETGDYSHCTAHNDSAYVRIQDVDASGAWGWWCDPKNDPLGLEVARNIPHFKDHNLNPLVLEGEIVGGYEQLWAIANGLADSVEPTP